MHIISPHHDPTAIFSPLITKHASALSELATKNDFVLLHTEVTDSVQLEKLADLGFHLEIGGKWGEAKKKGLQIVADRSVQHEFTLWLDFDRLLHWLAVASEELEEIISNKYQSDFICLNRSQSAFQSHPQSWQRTESIINDIISTIVGKQVDPYLGSVIVRTNKAKMLADKLKQPEWASVAETILQAYRLDLQIEAVVTDGTSWEDPDRFSAEIEEAGGLQQWKQLRYMGISEWKKRIDSMHANMQVIVDLYPDYEEFDNTVAFRSK